MAASREILAALGRDVANPGAVLDTVARVRRAPVRSGGRPTVPARRRRVPALAGLRRDPEEYRRYLLDHPIARNGSSTVGRAAEDKRTHQIPDVLADADYGRLDLQRLTGFRTCCRRR